VKQFYRQNAGLFAFLLFMLVVVVGRANDAGLLEYHLSLIEGMLVNPVIFLLVVLIWSLYAKKCEQFITRTLGRTEFSFLGILSFTGKGRLFLRLLEVQLLLFLPVILYAAIIAGVGFYKHWNQPVIWMLAYVVAVCLISAHWYLYLLQNPTAGPYRIRWRIPSLLRERFYWSILARYVLSKRKLLLLVVKIYSCSTLYLLLKQTQAGDNLNMVFLFYSFGLLGHGILIRQIRKMEETRLDFYRGMPLSLLSRYLQYACLYFFLFVPEIITIGWLAPVYLHFPDALLFIFFGYGSLLLLNSFLCARPFGSIAFLKLCVTYFFLVFIAVLTDTLLWLILLSFILSIGLFFSRYYAFERGDFQLH
jgi:hypothetical protein